MGNYYRSGNGPPLRGGRLMLLSLNRVLIFVVVVVVVLLLRAVGMWNSGVQRHVKRQLL